MYSQIRMKHLYKVFIWICLRVSPEDFFIFLWHRQQAFMTTKASLWKNYTKLYLLLKEKTSVELACNTSDPFWLLKSAKVKLFKSFLWSVVDNVDNFLKTLIKAEFYYRACELKGPKVSQNFHSLIFEYFWCVIYSCSVSLMKEVRCKLYFFAGFIAK